MFDVPNKNSINDSSSDVSPSKLVFPGIKGFCETSFVDWQKKVSSVIFIHGCNMRCGYCHNYPLVGKSSLPDISYSEIVKKLKALRGWIDGVVVSGGEPTLRDYLPRLLEDIKLRGFKTKLDTNGLLPNVVSMLMDMSLVDCIALDVKSPLNVMSYAKVAGTEVDVEKIKKTINILISGSVDYQFRITLSPILSISDYARLIQELNGAKYIILQKFKTGDILDNLINGLRNFSDEDIKYLARFGAEYCGKIDVVGVPI